MEQVERVPKNGYNDFHKYHYVMEADLVAHLRPLLAKAGVIIIPSLKSQKWTPNAVQERSGASALTRIVVEYTITDGKDAFTMNMPGYGVDRADKGIYKALTGSMKYALMKLFLVDTGDDPELPSTHDEPPADVVISGSQEKGIRKGGKSEKTTRYQLQRISATMREKGIERKDLLGIVERELGFQIVIDEEDDAAQASTIRAFLQDLDSDEAGKIIRSLDEWEPAVDAAT